jgi:uncharacterized protein (DUF1810 family)
MRMTERNGGSSNKYDLERFVLAQASSYAQARAELAAGSKRTHWMWFIFPQVQGLGSSGMAQQYAISGIEEAREYLGHPILGARLRECAGLVNAVEGRSPAEIFGYPDDLKFHSSMTLFARAAEGSGEEDRVFSEALAKYFSRSPDAATIRILQGSAQQ